VGADEVIDLSLPDLRDIVKERVANLTGGHGADIVIDPVGGEASAAAMRSLAWKGRMVVVGFASGEIPTVKANYLLVKNIAVLGLQWSDYRERAPEMIVAAQEEIFTLCVTGKIRPYISRRLPFADFKDALSALRNGQAKGKIILDVRHQ